MSSIKQYWASQKFCEDCVCVLDENGVCQHCEVKDAENNKTISEDHADISYNHVCTLGLILLSGAVTDVDI